MPTTAPRCCSSSPPGRGQAFQLYAVPALHLLPRRYLWFRPSFCTASPDPSMLSRLPLYSSDTYIRGAVDASNPDCSSKFTFAFRHDLSHTSTCHEYLAALERTPLSTFLGISQDSQHIPNFASPKFNWQFRKYLLVCSVLGEKATA